MAEPTILLLLALGLLAGWQVQRIRRGLARRQAWRANYLGDVLALLDDTVLRLEPNGFPRLAGTYSGVRFDLRVVPDTLTTRKLPALWVLATLTEPTPMRATWHLMLRPRGSETFSVYERLPRLLPPQSDLPQDSAVRTDSPIGEAPAILASVVQRLGADRLKEVILSPKGLRVTWLAEEADRGRYLLFRDVEMGQKPLDQWVAERLISTLLELRMALAPEASRLSA